MSAVAPTVVGPVASERVRRRLRVRGAVQGVGFRPFVYRLARSLDLTGFVFNSTEGATIEIEGEAARVEEFGARCQAGSPAAGSRLLSP